MTRYLFLFALIVGMGLTSCEKCADCSCTGAISFDFSDDISAADQDVLEDTWTNAYTTDYPDEEQELCSSRGDFDDEVAEYEAQTATYEENQTVGGEAYTATYVYTCECTE